MRLNSWKDACKFTFACRKQELVVYSSLQMDLQVLVSSGKLILHRNLHGWQNRLAFSISISISKPFQGRHILYFIDLPWIGLSNGEKLASNLIWNKLNASQCNCAKDLSLHTQVDPMDSRVNPTFHLLSTCASVWLRLY